MSTDDDLDLLTETGGPTDFERRTARADDRADLTVQLDYARPIGETRIEAGYRGDVESRISRQVAELRGETGGYTADPSQASRYDLDETVHGGYLQLARQVGPLAVQLGLRAEAASRSFVLSEVPFAYSDRNVFPSAAVAVDLGEATALRASYSRRIDRPRGRQLNPFPSTDDPLNVRVGNPELRPELTHAVEASVVRQTAWGTVTATPFLRRTTSVIRRFQSVDGRGVTTSTFRNLDTATSTGLEAVVAVQTGGPLRGFLSLEGFRRSTDGESVESGLSSDAFGWGGRLSVNYGVGDRLGLGDLDVQATGSYRAPQETEQGRIGSRVFVDLGLRQRLLSGRANLALRARDPFGWGTFDFIQDDARVFQTIHRSPRRQQVALTFTWTFGRTEERPDRQRPSAEGGGAETVDY